MMLGRVGVLALAAATLEPGGRTRQGHPTSSTSSTSRTRQGHPTPPSRGVSHHSSTSSTSSKRSQDSSRSQCQRQRCILHNNPHRTNIGQCHKSHKSHNNQHRNTCIILH